MRWLRWLRKRPNEAAQARAEAEAKLEAIRGRTPVVEQKAKQFSRVPPDRFLDRVSRAFGGRA